MEGAMQKGLGQAIGNYDRNATAYPAGIAPSVQGPEPTLLRALSTLDELNKRLSTLLAGSHEIACAVGGPYPTGGAEASGEVKPSSAMTRLNDSLGFAHRQVSDIEGAVSAIRRSLGGQ